jgi:hypothetical protein
VQSWIFNRVTLKPQQRKGGRIVVVLAILGLSFLPFRVFCELAHAHAAQAASATHYEQGGEESGPCCASVDDRALLESVTPDLSAGNGVALVVAALAPLLFVPGFPPGILRITGAPPPPRSYYARSARVLR